MIIKRKDIQLKQGPIISTLKPKKRGNRYTTFFQINDNPELILHKSILPRKMVVSKARLLYFFA